MLIKIMSKNWNKKKIGQKIRCPMNSCQGIQLYPIKNMEE